MGYLERRIDSDICARCPARSGTAMKAHVRGSSYRGRELSSHDRPVSDHCVIFVGETIVADVVIANEQGDEAAAEHDADFIHTIFERELPNCSRPTTELTSSGLQTLCTPPSVAVDEFINVNY
jgi:hypothetical protein